MTRCFAKVLLPTPFHHDSEIAKSVRAFAEATRAVWVHWPLRGKENGGKAPEALLEYSCSQDRVAALKENQAHPGEWGFFATADKRQPDEKRRKVRPRRPEGLADCEAAGNAREPMGDLDCETVWDTYGWDNKPVYPECFEPQAQLQCPPMQQLQQLDYASPQLGYGCPQMVQMAQCAGDFAPSMRDFSRWPGDQCVQRDEYAVHQQQFPAPLERLERPEPRRSPIIVVDSAGQPQELWSFSATHGPPGCGTWGSTVAPGPIAPPAVEDEEAWLLADAAQSPALALDLGVSLDLGLPVGGYGRELTPMPTPRPMPTPTRFGFIHYPSFTSECDSPVTRRRSSSVPPASMTHDFDAPLPLSPLPCDEDDDADSDQPETPPRPNGGRSPGTPQPVSAKKRRGGRGRQGKAKKE